MPKKITPSCYLDMDGLLANLFDHVAKNMHGKRYQHLSDNEKSEGRLVWEDKKLFKNKFGPIDKFFENLEPYHTNDVLLESVVEKFGGFYICSKPTKLNQKACIAGKLEWIQKHITPKYEKHLKGILFPERKEVYAVSEHGHPNVLIDDYKPYIHAWEVAGGFGIRLRSDRFESPESIKRHLKESFREVDKRVKILEGNIPPSNNSKQTSKKRKNAHALEQGQEHSIT
jgi:hypothetical protein